MQPNLNHHTQQKMWKLRFSILISDIALHYKLIAVIDLDLRFPIKSIFFIIIMAASLLILQKLIPHILPFIEKMATYINLITLCSKS